MDPVADIVIVNWNSGRFLRDCIDSIRTFGGGVVRQVVVVDNGSGDNSLDVDGTGVPLDIIQAGENLGFARACNLGASRCVSPYLLFLNPDALLMDGALEKCVAFMQSGAAAKIGICGARLLDERGDTQRHCAQFPVWRTYLGRTIGLDGFFPRVFPANFMREFDHLTSRRVDHVIGAFFLVRRSVFEEIGGFDERFFVYMEDLDFSLRAMRAGWSTWYLADAVAFHKGGGTSQRVKAARLFYSLRSRMLYAIKHFSRGQALALILLTLFVEPFTRLVRAASRGSGQEGWDTPCADTPWSGRACPNSFARVRNATPRKQRAVVEPNLLEQLRCPACREGRLTPGAGEKALLCTRCGASYPVSGGRPLLLRPDNNVFAADHRVSVVPQRSRLARFVPSPSINLSRNSTLQTMRRILDRRGKCNILVVGSGRQRIWLTPLMQVVRPHDLVYTDVSMEADVDIFCDAHDLPFADSAFDAVITTAVLEHVLYPERVAAEIARTLKSEGVLYSELPFMQQVHEGAYDFTRYTLSGHRRLFRQFAELESGMVAGPATALVWSIENFALAFFAGRRSRLATKAVVRILFSWLKHFDRILAKRPEALDGAACTFFLGAKGETPITDVEIIRGYTGAKYP